MVGRPPAGWSPRTGLLVKDALGPTDLGASFFFFLNSESLKLPAKWKHFGRP